jgi:hypothetical protein
MNTLILTLYTPLHSNLFRSVPFRSALFTDLVGSTAAILFDASQQADMAMRHQLSHCQLLSHSMQVNKLIWPAPGGIGVHLQESMFKIEAAAFITGIINKTVSAWFLNHHSLGGSTPPVAQGGVFRH